MFKNYILIAFRNIERNKLYSAINIIGLSIGVACCLILALYVQDELQYDKHHDRKEDLYRVVTTFEGDRGFKTGSCSPPIAMGMWAEIPEIEVATRLLNPPNASQNLIRYKDNTFYESNGFLADSTVFDVFSFQFVEGNPAKALTEANSVVISDKLAGKLFGSESALNKIITITQGGPTGDFLITGVFVENLKSHVTPSFIVSITSAGWGEYLSSPNVSDEWGGQNFIPSYFKLTPGHTVAAVEKKMNEVLIKYGAEDMKALGMHKTLSLEPLQDIYLKSETTQAKRISYLYVIASIAGFILVLACINFMNLSTAKATKRASEIGIRKVMGAVRSSLIGQLMGEAMTLVILALLVSVVLVQVTLPFFNTLTEKSISLNNDTMIYFAIALAVIACITGLLAGSYPAFYLSSFQPAQVLKGKFALNNASGFFRQALVVFQFMIGIALVCGVLIIRNQLNFLEDKNLGFNPEAKIVLPLRTPTAQQQYHALQQELSRLAGVESVSGTDYIPGSRIFSDFSLYKPGDNVEQAIIHRNHTIDYGYIELLELKLIAGRTFTNNRETESQRKIVVNRASVESLGFTPEEAVGQTVTWDWQGVSYPFEIIGVVEDYHHTSLKDEIYPIVLRINPPNSSFDFAIASITTHDAQSTLASIESVWKNIIDDTPFEFVFLDENIQRQYQQDRRISSIITVFTIIAMVISCLGLYGLSSYMAERRFKEIGIRKVMGANVSQIVSLLSKEFIRLVTIAFILAVPLAWYGMNEWLNTFAYRIDISMMIFILAGSVALLIAIITVSYESIKAASANPVTSLRSE